MKNYINWLLFLVLVCTFLLINLGGLVHNTGSSLACPDWPLCYGEVMPEMTGGVLVEHSHRLLGSLVGFLIILNLFFTWKRFGKKSFMTKLAILALVMVVFQGLLGGITVIYKLPTIISTMHLATSMLVICLVYFMYRKMQVKPMAELTLSDDAKKTWFKNLNFFLGCSLIMVYGQIILGAAMRHLGLGGACGVGAEHSFLCFDMINNHAGPFPTSIEAGLNAFHRYFAIFISLFTISWSLYYRKNKSMNSGLASRLLLVNVIVVIQILLGVMTVFTEIGVWATTLHLSFATILLLSLFETFLYWREFSKSTNMINANFSFSDWFSLTKPRLSSLVLCTCFLGIMLAPGTISILSAFMTMFGIYLVVSGSCMMNCYSEREVDKHMDRTKNRALPAGRIDANQCMVAALALCFIGTALLYIFVNPLSAGLSLLASLLYIFLYTPLKQHSPIALFIGAIPGAIPPLVGWVSVTNEITFWGVLLFSILFVWQLPHFLAIAIFHAKDYEKAGIKVLPNTAGVQATKIRIFLYSFLLVAISLLPVYMEKSKEPIYLFTTLILGLFFVLLAFRGLLLKNNQLELNWSRRYFWSTLAYLPMQLSILVVYG